MVGGLVIIFLGQPPLFGPFTPFRPAVSASIAGMLAYGNWHLPAVALLSLILVWLLLPIGAEAFVVLTFHMAGLAMILLLRGKIEDLLRSTNHKKASLGSFSAAYCGNISRHLFGNILSATMLKMPSLFFILALPYTFVEQLIFATGTTIIGVSLSKLGLREVLQPRDP